jgi:dipeptidyl-peptidase-4
LDGHGGFMASNCILKGMMFKMAIAVAPVTNWRFYDSIYTERHANPQENASGYDENSPINHRKLKGNTFNSRKWR